MRRRPSPLLADQGLYAELEACRRCPKALRPWWAALRSLVLEVWTQLFVCEIVVCEDDVLHAHFAVMRLERFHGALVAMRQEIGNGNPLATCEGAVTRRLRIPCSEQR